MSSTTDLALAETHADLRIDQSAPAPFWSDKRSSGRIPTERDVAHETDMWILSVPPKLASPVKVARELLRSHPSQSFQIVDLAGFQHNASSLAERLQSGQPRLTLAYSIKANPRCELLQILWESGVRTFDCASLGEIELLRSVVPSADVIYNYDHKGFANVCSALRLGVQRFAVQDHEELDLLAQCCTEVGRPRQNVEAGVRLRQRTLGAEIPFSERFGADPRLARALIERVRAIGFRKGLYVHPGSQLINPGALAQSAEGACQFARSVGGVHTLNLGGGVPVARDDRTTRESITTIKAALEAGAAGALELCHDSRIVLELGRAIAAPAITLLAPILKVDRSVCRLFLGCGLFDTFSDHVIHGVQFDFEPLSREGSALSTDQSSWEIYGPTCDPGDRFRSLIDLPSDLASGDGLLLHSAGAYTDSQGGGFRAGPWQRRPAGFNGRPGPMYVGYHTEGEKAPVGLEPRSELPSTATATLPTRFRTENLDSASITDDLVREVTELFLEAFCNDWDEWAFCPDCDPRAPTGARVSAIEAYGLEPGQFVTADRLLDDPRLPYCERCHKRMVHFHHPWATYEKLRTTLRSNAWLTTIRLEREETHERERAGELIGLTYGYRTTLRGAFESEWRLAYPYSAWSEKERHTRSWSQFQNRVSKVVARHFPSHASKSASLPGDTPILIHNCFVLRRGVSRGRGLFRGMVKEFFWNNLPRETLGFLTLGETRYDTHPHRLLSAAGFTCVPGVVLPAERSLRKGDYVLGVNVLERYAVGLTRSASSGEER